MNDREVLEALYATVENRRDNPKEGSYTCYLLDKGIDKILKKVGEECSETIIAAKNDDNSETVYEIADLIYHLTVMMLRNGDNTVDAHSLMGFFAIDEKIPIELLLEAEPDDNLKQAISKFAFVNA